MFDTILTAINDFTALFYPEFCAACDVILIRGERTFCTSCRISLPRTNYALLPDNPVARQFWGKIKLVNAYSFLHFNKGERVQHLLHLLKYKNRPEIGVECGRMFAEELKHMRAALHFDYIIPVPLHPYKEKLRGYNQATCFGKGLSAGLYIPQISNVLIRKTHTDSQTKMGRYARYMNMEGVFALTSAEKLINKHVLLIDDVITTGSTLCSCASLLTKNNTSVTIASIAFAGN